MTTSWTVTVTFQGIPSEAVLTSLEDRLPHSGFAAAVPRRNQYTVTTTIDSPEPEKALSVAGGEIFDQVRTHLGEHPIVVGMEVLMSDEYDRRADEPTIPEIVSAPDVAEMLDVRRQRVHQLLSDNPRFPKPFMRLGSGPLWVADAIRRFDREWERKPGRPPLRKPKQQATTKPKKSQDRARAVG
jgi:hypothetical protein